jgi:hypothetical protein
MLAQICFALSAELTSNILPNFIQKILNGAPEAMGGDYEHRHRH